MTAKLPAVGDKIGFKADRAYSEAEMRRKNGGHCGHWWGVVVKVENNRATIQYAHPTGGEPVPAEYSAYKFNQMFYVIPE